MDTPLARSVIQITLLDHKSHLILKNAGDLICMRNEENGLFYLPWVALFTPASASPEEILKARQPLFSEVSLSASFSLPCDTILH